MGVRQTISAMAIAFAVLAGIDSQCGEDDRDPFGVPGFHAAEHRAAPNRDELNRSLQQALAVVEPLAQELTARQSKIAAWDDVVKKCEALDDERRGVQAGKDLPRSERESKAYAIEREKSRLMLTVGTLQTDLFSALKDLRAETTALDRRVRAKQAVVDKVQAQIDALDRELKRKDDADRFALKMELLKASNAVAELTTSRNAVTASLNIAQKRIAQCEKELADAEAENRKWQSQLEPLAKRSDLSDNEKKVKGYLEAYTIQWPQQKDSLQKKVVAARHDLDAKIEQQRDMQSKINVLLAELQTLTAKQPN